MIGQLLLLLTILLTLRPGGIDIERGQLNDERPLGISTWPDSRTTVIEPAPGVDLRGRVTASTLHDGTLLLRVEVRGQPNEVSPEALPLWHIGSGTCAAWREGKVQAVDYRFNPAVETPGHQAFTIAVTKQNVAPPMVLAAFVQGGGPMLVCADLPM